MNKLDTKPRAAKAKRARKPADQALSPYGKPAMSLEELRAMADQELKRLSLTEFIPGERETGR